MRLFLSFLLLMRLACHAQTITGASTDERGYKLYIYLTGLNTNGTFNLGWITNNQPSLSNKAVVSISKPGFKPVANGSPVPTNWPCTIYGTRQLRFPYPGDAYPETEAHGSGIRIAIGLTQYVFSEDSSISLTTLSGPPSNLTQHRPRFACDNSAGTITK